MPGGILSKIVLKLFYSLKAVVQIKHIPKKWVAFTSLSTPCVSLHFVLFFLFVCFGIVIVNRVWKDIAECM